MILKFFIVVLMLFPFHAAAQNECAGLGEDVSMCAEVTDKNVLGEPLKLCCDDPVTGFFRNGFCQTGPQDHGTHVACARVTTEFLEFSKAQGNDLMTPNPDYFFPGLKDGDQWCLCAARWTEALEAGVAPPLDLEATHEKMLEYAEIEVLQKYAISNDVIPSEVEGSDSQKAPDPSASLADAPSAQDDTLKGAHSFSFENIEGGEINLADLKGKPFMVVNTASFCGFTAQYADLQDLYDKYKDQGFTVIAVPSNNFGGQEPYDEAAIQDFTTSQYGINFPVTRKYDVKGGDVHPFYEWAGGQKKGGLIFSKPRWNFHKYLIGPDGELVKSFGSQVKPLSDKITTEIEKLL